MPTRLIREGLLDSERYWSCTIEARELFTHLMLLADDFGCLSMSPASIGRRCFDQRPTSEKLAKLVTQLCDADLIRQYQEGGATFAFIPRFRQRLQRFTLKHPKPPESIIGDDEHAKDLFKRINSKRQTSAVDQPIANGSPTHEVELKRSRREVEVKAPVPVDNLPPRIAGALQNLLENLPSKPSPEVDVNEN